MSLFGTVPNFDHRQNDWSIFLSQLENFFIANDIDETKVEKKKAILITSLSEESLKLVQNLIQPEETTSKSYSEIVEVLNKHFKPAQSGFAERFKFYTAYKDHKETIQQWAARVRSLAASCDFDSHLVVALRDKFIMGLPKGPAKDTLFLEDAKTLTLDKAVEIALNVECIRTHYEGERQTRRTPKSNESKSFGQQNKGQHPPKPRKGNEGQQSGKPKK